MKTYPEGNRARGGRIPVRGACKAGHVTETKSDPGRITWSGECAADGCTEQIHAKRIPTTIEPAAEVHTPPEPDDTETVREVSYEQHAPKRRDNRPAGGASAVPGTPAGTGPAPVVDVDERTPAAEFESDDIERPRGIVDESGSGLVDQTPPRRRRPRQREQHVFQLPWE